MAVRVEIGEAGKIVVSRIGVAALAIGEVVPYRVVVIALDDVDAGIAKERKHLVGIGTESSEIAEAI
jgi:hypothetical protein